LAPWAGRAFAALFRAGALVEVLREAVLREAVFERDFAIGLVLFLRDQNYGPKRRGRLLKADADGECNADAITPSAAYRFPERAPQIGLVPVEEVMHAVQPHDADENEVYCDDVVEQSRDDQNQDAGEKRDQRRDVGSGNDHDPNLLVDLSDC